MAEPADPRRRVVVQESPAGRVAVVRLLGEHDASSTPSIRSALLALVTRPLVVVDLADCTFLDSSAIGLLVGMRRRLGVQSGELIIVHACGAAARALGVLGLPRVIACYDREGHLTASA